jgi:RHS repeat-associated protein
VTSYSYDSTGNILGYLYPNTFQTIQAYDTLNRLTQISTSRSGLVSSFQYTLGPAGNRLSVAELSGRTVNYDYDADYRLTSEAITADPSGNNGTLAYSYDGVGNRLQLSSTLSAILGGPSTYDANDRLTLDTYDANGNTISSAGISSSYDFEDRLIQQGAINIVYDGDGNRVAETSGGVTTQFLVADINPTHYPQVIDELVGNSVVRSHTYGLNHISENQLINGVWAPSFYGYDGHGNVRFLANTVGSVTDTYQFDAFGNSIASTGTTPNNYLYSGEPFDSGARLYQLRARWYKPLTGRFITRDPWDGHTCSMMNYDPYIYASDDPVNRGDPTGRNAVALPRPVGNEYLALLVLISFTALPAVQQLGRTLAKDFGCMAKLIECLENPWQPEWNVPDFGRRKDCGACYRECVHAGGDWPEYKCPSP